MKKVAALIVLLIVVSAAALSAETTIPSGDVAGRWEKSGSPYLITGDIVIDEGEKLEIEDGVQVRFMGPFSLTVNGVLQAGEGDSEGREETEKIVFETGLKKKSIGWKGIRFDEAGEDTWMIKCIVRNVRTDEDGGAVTVHDCEVAFADCIFENNVTSGDGGALSVIDGEAALASCTVRHNESKAGALYVEGGELSVADCEISANKGAGIVGKDCEIALAASTIIGNESAEYGGIYIADGELSLAGATVKGNHGGGIKAVDSEVAIVGCTIQDNKGCKEGGGIVVRKSELTIVDSDIIGNSVGGLGVYEESAASLLNSTIDKNKMFPEGGNAKTDEESELLIMSPGSNAD